MKTYAHIDGQTMAKLNKQSVMQCISDYGPISRSEIACQVGLSVPAVMDITEVLLSHGMISAELKEGKVRGKRPEMLSVCGSNHHFVGVDVGRTMTRIVLTGLDQRVICASKYATRGVESPQAYIDELCERITHLIASNLGDASTVIGVCVAMPGLIERDTGRVIFSPNFGWENVPLQERMNELLPVQVIVENANRVQASWEMHRDADNKEKTILCIGLGYGIGGGLYLNGEMLYGASGTSGEVGHMQVSQSSQAVCSCGNKGCLESVASGAALEREARRLVESGEDPFLLELCGGDAERLEAKTLFLAAERGDAIASSVIEQAADHISVGLATCINLLDPDRIYLCGGMMRNRFDFLNMIRTRTMKRQMYKAGRSTLILAGDKDEWNVARGATRIIPYYMWDTERLNFMR